MSRYPIPAHASLRASIPHVCVVVGWDNPLQTFFGQVLDPDRPLTQPETVTWIGTRPAEIRTVEELVSAMEPYGTMPEAIVVQLRQEWSARTQATPLQEHMVAMLQRGGRA
jgi:hypothetical protein